MNYKEKYEQALERARTSFSYPDYPGFMRVDVIFPELKENESEDEKIRKEIYIYLDWLDGRKDYAPKGNYTIRQMLAWLEKQGEKKNTRKREIDDSYLQGVCDAKHEIEKQVKKIDADKVIEWLKNTINERAENYGVYNETRLILPYNSIEDLINDFKEDFGL